MEVGLDRDTLDDEVVGDPVPEILFDHVLELVALIEKPQIGILIILKYFFNFLIPLTR